MFIVYINDLSKHLLNSHVSLYADDTAISVTGPNFDVIQTKLQGELNAAAIWFRNNKLTLNLDKTKLMFFGTHYTLDGSSDMSVTYGGVEIGHVTKFKYLGLMLDGKMSFSEHVNYMKSKTIGKIKLLSRIRSILDEEVALVLYKTLILPIYDYNDYIYDSLNMKDAYELQKLQNSALRVILHQDRYASIHAMHADLDVEWLDERHKLHTAHNVYKGVHGLGPIAFNNMFTPLSDIVVCDTRASARGNLVVLNYNLETTRGNPRW